MKEEKKEMKMNEKWIANKIGYEGAKSISESLKINTSLTLLFLNGDEKIIMKKVKRNEKNE